MGHFDYYPDVSVEKYQFSIVLFWSGINWIPQIYHEQCQLDGATGRQEFQYITWILLKPTTLVVSVDVDREFF